MSMGSGTTSAWFGGRAGIGDPLRGAPNTVLLPHLGYVTEAGYRSMYKQVVGDVAAWRAGSPMRVLTA
jgi:phosphoglycerate dehydrogenase-like enzyme